MSQYISLLDEISLKIEELRAAMRTCSSGQTAIAPKYEGVIRPSESDMDQAIAKRDSGFKFSSRSRGNLEGVKASLVAVAKTALRQSTVDFIVVDGLRTKAEQSQLVESGASQTLKSKHLTGDAIDVAAWVDGDISWKAAHYLCIATAFSYAADAHNVRIRWGGAWNQPNIGECAKKPTPGKTMLELYKQLRRSQGRGVFLDLGHFELN